MVTKVILLTKGYCARITCDYFGPPKTPEASSCCRWGTNIVKFDYCCPPTRIAATGLYETSQPGSSCLGLGLASYFGFVLLFFSGNLPGTFADF
jgi:hypothetical protein